MTPEGVEATTIVSGKDAAEIIGSNGVCVGLGKVASTLRVLSALCGCVDVTAHGVCLLL